MSWGNAMTVTGHGSEFGHRAEEVTFLAARDLHGAQVCHAPFRPLITALVTICQ